MYELASVRFSLNEHVCVSSSLLQTELCGCGQRNPYSLISSRLENMV